MNSTSSNTDSSPISVGIFYFVEILAKVILAIVISIEGKDDWNKSKQSDIDKDLEARGTDVDNSRVSSSGYVKSGNSDSGGTTNSILKFWHSLTWKKRLLYLGKIGVFILTLTGTSIAAGHHSSESEIFEPSEI